MDFALLFDPATRLFHIGYNLSADRIDPHHYDLLASEARLASYFAIAKGGIAPEHWFHLRRPITRKDTGLALVSRSEERRVGIGCVSTCRSRWPTKHYKNNKTLIESKRHTKMR